MRIVDCVQGESQWFAEKLGKPSASNASKLITGSGKRSTQREGYLHTLIAEKLTGERYDAFKTTEAMEEGVRREAESRKLYEFVSDDVITEVGVVYPDKTDKYLCSPDGLCDEKKYGLELKNVMPKTQIKYLLKGTMPTEYILQVQFSLMVTELDYWVFASYCPKLEPLIVKVERDEVLINTLKKEVEVFCDEIDENVKKLGGKK